MLHLSVSIVGTEPNSNWRRFRGSGLAPVSAAADRDSADHRTCGLSESFRPFALGYVFHFCLTTIESRYRDLWTKIGAGASCPNNFLSRFLLSCSWRFFSGWLRVGPKAAIGPAVCENSSRQTEKRPSTHCVNKTPACQNPTGSSVWHMTSNQCRAHSL